jgi:FixJ family two-component response regulator
MPETSGIELLEQLVTLGKKFPVILMTGGGGTMLRGEAEQLGAAAFLEKPFRSAHLQEVIAKVL